MQDSGRLKEAAVVGDARSRNLKCVAWRIPAAERKGCARFARSRIRIEVCMSSSDPVWHKTQLFLGFRNCWSIIVSKNSEWVLRSKSWLGRAEYQRSQASSKEGKKKEKITSYVTPKSHPTSEKPDNYLPKTRICWQGFLRLKKGSRRISPESVQKSVLAKPMHVHLYKPDGAGRTSNKMSSSS